MNVSEAMEMAKSNAQMGFDQKHEYDHPRDAWWAYIENMDDTLAENKAEDYKTVCSRVFQREWDKLARPAGIVLSVHV